MPMIPLHRYCLLLLVLLPAVALTGCGKSDFVVAVEQNPYFGLPGDTQHLHSLDLGRLRTRRWFQDDMARREQGDELRRLLDGLRDHVGFDLIRQIDQINLGQRGVAEEDRPFGNTILIARGRFEGLQGRLDDLRRWLGEEWLIQPRPFEQVQHAGFTIHRLEARSQFNEQHSYRIELAFPSDQLLVLSLSPTLMADSLAVIAGQVEGLRLEEGWRQRLNWPDLSAVAWGGGDFSPPDTVALAPMASDISGLTAARHYFYDVGMADQIRFGGGLAANTIEEATQLTESVRAMHQAGRFYMVMHAQQLPVLAELYDRIMISNNLNRVQLVVTASQDQMSALVRELWALVQKEAAGDSALRP